MQTLAYIVAIVFMVLFGLMCFQPTEYDDTDCAPINCQ